MRLIDADAYKQYCEEEWIPLNYNAVDAQPTVQQWIRCSERLPEDEDYHECLPFADGAVRWITNKGVKGIGWYYDSTKKWSDCNDHWDEATYGNVIAWMPLPDTWEGE